MDLHAKVALVTGGAVRVGRGIALGLAAAGANVVFNYHSSATEATRTVEELRNNGVEALAIAADVSNAADVDQMVAAAIEHFGRLDVLVNSASLFERTPWAELDEAAWDRILGVGLKGPFLCARTSAPHLAAHGDGLIVNIIDLAAYQPFPNFMPHSAAKAGLLNLTYALAAELAPEVRVNAIAPGPILPPTNSTAAQNVAAIQRTVLGRWGSPADVAQAVVYFAEAPFVTGTVLKVDGGEHLGRRAKHKA